MSNTVHTADRGGARKAAGAETAARKERRPPKWGVQPAAIAICRVCGWQGATHLNAGCRSGAWAELKYHVQKDHPQLYKFPGLPRGV